MKYLIANWKMKLSPKQEKKIALKLANIKIDTKKINISINPQTSSLQTIAKIFKKTDYNLGAQNCFWQESGAYTGETSPKFLKKIGCQNVIIGHSERRQYLGETNTMINKKIHKLIDLELTPILCVGESAEERRSGSKDHVLRRQVELGLKNIEIVGNQKIIIAYEPIWAIGSGQSASVTDIIYMHQVIYQTLIDLFAKSAVENNTYILYGGSVNAKNIKRLLKEEMIDGVLIGSAALKIKEFAKIIKIANSL